MRAVTVPALPRTLAWLRAAVGDAVPETLVPGATAAERTSLAALGAVAAHVMQGKVPTSWPEPIRDWLSTPIGLPDEVSDELETAVEKSPDETLASLYSGIVAGPRRRVLGTFFTPSNEVAPMLEMWTRSQEAPETVIDVGAGVGVFTAAASQRWDQAEVLAVDINPVTLGLLGARMTQSDVCNATGRVRLILEDYTTWLPKQSSNPDRGRLFLGNPPYTRAQLIPLDVRSRLVRQCGSLCGTRSSLSTFITALTLQQLGPHDGLCLLLPAQWLESAYGRNLRQHLLDLRHRRVELRLAESELFSDATVDAVMLLVGTEREAEEPFVISGWGDADRRPIDRGTASTEGWRSWFGARSSAPADVSADARTLSDLVALRRGTATGANEFFVLSDRDVEKHQVPRQALQPVVRRLGGYGNTVTEAAFNRLSATDGRWLLTVTPATATDPAVAAYLQHGVAAGYPDRHLCRVRRGEWYDVTHDVTIPDVIITPMIRGQVRVAENKVGAAITNNLYGWRWKKGVTHKVRTTGRLPSRATPCAPRPWGHRLRADRPASPGHGRRGVHRPS